MTPARIHTRLTSPFLAASSRPLLTNERRPRLTNESEARGHAPAPGPLCRPVTLQLQQGMRLASAARTRHPGRSMPSWVGVQRSQASGRLRHPLLSRQPSPGARRGKAFRAAASWVAVCVLPAPGLGVIIALDRLRSPRGCPETARLTTGRRRRRPVVFVGGLLQACMDRRHLALDQRRPLPPLAAHPRRAKVLFRKHSIRVGVRRCRPFAVHH